MKYSQVLHEIFSQFKGQTFALELWDGQTYVYGDGKSLDFTLVLHNERAAKRLLALGALGFGESYMSGDLEVRGNLDAYLRLRHQFKHVKKTAGLLRAVFLARLSSLRRRSDQIAYHYDIGNEFFGLFLDAKTMSYSAGRFELGSEDLVTAQTQKLELIMNWLRLPNGANVLDLGSGWGGFAAYAAKKAKWHIRGYSLSKKQLSYARRLIKRERVEKNVSFHYKDMLATTPKGAYDAIVMIESIEHVGKDNLPNFFNTQFRALAPGGSLYIQTTGRHKVRRVDAWTLKYVFPGGYLPSLGELVSAAGEAGFVLEKYSEDTPDYLRTMQAWINGLESHKEDIIRMFDEPFYRLWELWMHGAKVAFEVGSMNLFRLHFKRPSKLP